MTTTTKNVKRSSDVRLLLLAVFVLVVVIGVIQGAYIPGIIAGCMVLIAYTAYEWARRFGERDTRLDMIERRLDRIEKKLFE